MPDRRLTRTELERAYGALGANASIDWSHLDDEDALFAGGHERHEPEVGSARLAARAEEALRWLAARPAAQRRSSWWSTTVPSDQPLREDHW